MYTLEHFLDDKPYHSRAFDFYFSKARIGVLDIETTGLSPDKSHFILGGFLSFTENGTVFRQFFAESLSEEPQLLSAFFKEVSCCDVLITYNGKRFDLPFLKVRAEHLCVPIPAFPYNFDLYLVLNKFSSLRKLLPNLRQKTVENFLGLWDQRKDEINGSQSVSLYQDYLISSSSTDHGNQRKHQLRDLMLLHNHDDVRQLARLLPILEKADLHGAMHTLGFPVISGTPPMRLTVENIVLDSNFLHILGTQESNPVDLALYENFDTHARVRFEKRNKRLEIKCRVVEKSGLLLLDLQRMPVDVCEDLCHYPNFGDGYLVLSAKNRVNYMEIHCFVQAFLGKMIKKNWGGV